MIYLILPTHMIYKVYIGLVYEVTKDILHWQITLFIQENTPVIKKQRISIAPILPGHIL